MTRSLFSVALLVIVLTLLSAIYSYFRAGTLASDEQITSKGLAAASRDTAIFYAGIAIGVGIIGYFVFRGMTSSSPDLAPTRFITLAVGIGVVLEILGAIVFKMRGLADLTVLHVIHIVGYGWFLPRIFPL